MIIDLLAAVVITYGFYRGYSKGMINTVVDTLSILIGLVIALKFSPILIEYLQQSINVSPSIEFILGFLIVFFVVILILRFIGEKLEDLFKAVKLNFLNQLAGGVLLGFVFTFCIGALLLLLSNLKIISASVSSESTLYEHLISVSKEGGWVFETFKNLFVDFWDKFMATIDQVKVNMEK